jgi:hypothetical protein
MKPINIEKLMNQSIGVSNAYYRATENDILEDYLKACLGCKIESNLIHIPSSLPGIRQDLGEEVQLLLV